MDLRVASLEVLYGNGDEGVIVLTASVNHYNFWLARRREREPRRPTSLTTSSLSPVCLIPVTLVKLILSESHVLKARRSLMDIVWVV